MRPLAAIQRLDATIPAQLLKDADPNPDARSRLDEIMLLRASPQPRKIFGVAVNYRSPASADAAPAYPVLCSKFWSLAQARVIISDCKHDYNHEHRFPGLAGLLCDVA